MYTNRPFIWAYQRIFRISAQAAAESLFRKIDAELTPNVILLGVSDKGKDNIYPVCYEPEDGAGYNIEMFSRLFEQNVECDNKENLQSTKITEDKLYKGDKGAARSIELKECIQELLNSIDSKRDIVSYCSIPVKVQNYIACIILQFPGRVLSEHYSSMGTGRVGNAFVSLLQSCVTEFLSNCSRALMRPEDLGTMLDIIDQDYREFIINSGRYLIDNQVSPLCGPVNNHSLFDSCNSISCLKYEGLEAKGRIIITRRGHPGVKMHLIFKNPISMNNHRAVRKLLELSTDEYSLAGDASYVYGLGCINSEYEFSQKDVFMVQFLKYSTWELYHFDNLLMNVSQGKPSFVPSGSIDRRKFASDLRRIFTQMDDESAVTLWKLASEASKQKHGTMLVISSGAKQEAERLNKQSTGVMPVKITPKVLSLVSCIDGAVLIDQNAICYAIGVILDGIATEKGDSSRGARFNSAIRYIESTSYECLIIVVSEDGMINLIPNLRAQINRSSIEEKIVILRNINEANSVNIKKYDTAMQWLVENKFYLSGEMCEEINKLKSRIEEKIGSSEERNSYEDLCPDSEMNDSYFIS